MRKAALTAVFVLVAIVTPATSGVANAADWPKCRVSQPDTPVYSSASSSSAREGFIGQNKGFVPTEVGTEYNSTDGIWWKKGYSQDQPSVRGYVDSRYLDGSCGA